MKYRLNVKYMVFFLLQAEDGIRDVAVTGVQTCALPICPLGDGFPALFVALHLLDRREHRPGELEDDARRDVGRSEEHTSELQSRLHLVCRLLLEKKKYHSHERPATQDAKPRSQRSTRTI